MVDDTTPGAKCPLPRAERAGNHPSLWEYLEQEVWPVVPSGDLGRVLSREEEDQILGYGSEGC